MRQGFSSQTYDYIPPPSVCGSIISDQIRQSSNDVENEVSKCLLAVALETAKSGRGQHLKIQFTVYWQSPP